MKIYALWAIGLLIIIFFVAAIAVRFQTQRLRPAILLMAVAFALDALLAVLL
jgi:hypothetical protein